MLLLKTPITYTWKYLIHITTEQNQKMYLKKEKNHKTDNKSTNKHHMVAFFCSGTVKHSQYAMELSVSGTEKINLNPHTQPRTVFKNYSK